MNRHHPDRSERAETEWLPNEVAVDGHMLPIEVAMAHFGVPGLSVAVIRDHAVERAFWAGRCPSTGRPIGPDTMFQVGSTSKLITAFGAMALADLGILDPDTDVRGLLRSWQPPAGTLVTISQLLSHTAGCNVHGFLGYGPDDDLPDLVGVLEGRGNSPAVGFEAPPGKAYSYSGGGYCVVQQAIEDLTGQSFDAVMRHTVIAPSGSQASFSTGPPDLGALDDESLGHPCAVTAGSINSVPMVERWRLHPELAAAGLWSSASDLARLMIQITRSIRGDSGSPAPRSGRRLVQPVELADGSMLAHGVGAVLDAEDAPTRFSHGGRNLGYCSENEVTIDGSRGIVVLTNGFPGGRPLARAIIQQHRSACVDAG
jgi:CubicO group peptidase (beta-lactamase class C family)